MAKPKINNKKKSTVCFLILFPGQVEHMPYFSIPIHQRSEDHRVGWGDDKEYVYSQWKTGKDTEQTDNVTLTSWCVSG